MAIALFLVTAPVSILAGSDIPNLKGTWVWEDQAAIHFRSPELPDKTHMEAKTRYAEIAFTSTIDKQEGFRFSGTKVSKKWTETILGVIGFDNKTVYMVDDNRFYFCRLVSPDKMEEIYLHATKTHSVASRGYMIRKR